MTMSGCQGGSQSKQNSQLGYDITVDPQRSTSQHGPALVLNDCLITRSRGSYARLPRYSCSSPRTASALVLTAQSCLCTGNHPHNLPLHWQPLANACYKQSADWAGNLQTTFRQHSGNIQTTLSHQYRPCATLPGLNLLPDAWQQAPTPGPPDHTPPST